jgi:uncharacterized iron-regulated protein
MNRERILWYVGALLASLMLLGAARPGDDRAVLRVADRATIPFSVMVQETAEAKFLFIGELHGVEDHHRIQLAVIRALHEADVPLAVGLEMFRAEHQRELDRWVDGSLPIRDFRRFYEDNWTLPWPLYRDIFEYARDHRIPLAGLNVPGEITRKVARSGFSSLSPEDLKKLPAGISCSVDNAYMDFIRRAHGPHGLRGASFQYFCEAQMVWDRAMAKHLADFAAKDRARMVVVLAGSAHAWRRGIPNQLAQYVLSSPSRVIMPLLSGTFEDLDVTTDDADYVVQ